jgi:hypothetical protein
MAEPKSLTARPMNSCSLASSIVVLLIDTSWEICLPAETPRPPWRYREGAVQEA